MPRCIGGHPEDVYCSCCRPLEDYTKPPQDGLHRHHMPSNCEHILDPNCGKGFPEPQCPGCVKEIAKVFPRMNSSVAEQTILETAKKVKELYDDHDASMEKVNSMFKGPGYEERVKNIEGKPPMSLISPLFLEQLAQVLAHGSQKYAPNMWRSDPMPFTHEIDSVLRHILAFNRGEDADPDSGLPHLAHAACRLMFLIERTVLHPEMDNRWRENA